MNAPEPLSPTERTRLGRLAERGRTSRIDLYDVLDDGMICHLGVIIDSTPVVLPTVYGRVDDTLYLHGSSGNRSLRAADGNEVCVTVTHLDGLVCARSAFHHSANYRSAVVFGTARVITSHEERLAALRAITEQLIPGRWDHVRAPSRKELAATAVLAVPLAEASVKAHSGPPADDPADLVPGTWAGVVPAGLAFGEPEPDPFVRPGTPAPDHVCALRGRSPIPAAASGGSLRA